MVTNVFIIAEAGVNHNGSLELAKKLIDIGVDAGVDAIKFQTFTAETLASKSAPKAGYQLQTTKETESQYDMLKRLELNKADHVELISYCQSKHVKFMSSPFDIDSVALLAKLGLDVFKIPSGEITNILYLRALGRLNKNVILSTGMSTIGEIEAALEILISEGTQRDNITLLHANTEYPTPLRDVNLRAMNTIGDTFKLAYGYSDHTQGIEVSLAAVARGATVIEKHITLDKTMDGPDHKASLDADELKLLVAGIRNIEMALGSAIKCPSPSELKVKPIARKSLVAKVPIKKGDLFTSDNLTIKRPGTGIDPMQYDKILNSVAVKDYSLDELI